LPKAALVPIPAARPKLAKEEAAGMAEAVVIMRGQAEAAHLMLPTSLFSTPKAFNLEMVK